METKIKKFNWFAQWYRNVSFRGIIVMGEAKYLNIRYFKYYI